MPAHPLLPRAALCAGARVFLRRPTARDRDEYLTLRRASRAFLRPWEPAPTPGSDPDSPEAFTGYLRQARARARAEKLLVCRRADAAIVGGINANEIVRGVFQSAYLGYWIGAPHARQGYMGEALALFLERSFGELELHRVEANVLPDNTASLALVRRAGFRREGLSPRYLKIAGRWQDHERWALLAEDGRAPR
jgi:ribosomal-protein-alanine N-acetyltransferase